MRDKKIMEEKEIQFLEAMHSLIYYREPESNELQYFKDGVPQGSSLSPNLFNIYLEAFLEYFGKKLNIQYEDYEYANDLCLIIRNKYLKSFIQGLSQEGVKWNLILNKAKYGNIKLKQQQQTNKYIEGIQIVDKYTYLGIIMNRQENLKNHIIKLKQRLITQSKNQNGQQQFKGKLINIPKTYEQLLNKGGYKCKQHQQRATYKHLVKSHLKQNLNTFNIKLVMGLKVKMAQACRTSDRIIKRLQLI